MFLSDSCVAALRSVFCNDLLNRYKLIVKDDTTKREGFLSNVHFITLENIEDPKNTMEIVLKEMSDKVFQQLNIIFNNEKFFYKYFKPMMESFQKNLVKNVVNHFPHCYGTYEDEKAKFIIMENVKVKGYNTLNSKKCWDDEHMSYVCRIYGKWHGLSFALRQKHPTEYETLRSSLSNSWTSIAALVEFQEILKNILEEVSKHLLDEDLRDEFVLFADTALNEFNNASTYAGKHSIIVHGDAWVNNLMFKYNKSQEIEDIRIIDFQTVTSGTPVWDISYAIFSGSPISILSKIDDYLKIYHGSLEETLRSFNCDPGLYTLEDLLKEWEIYHKYGYILSFIDIKSRSDNDESMFAERTSDLVKYMFHYNRASNQCMCE